MMTITQADTFSALVVDDNYYNRDIASLALRHVGYQVEEASDGAQALKLLNEQEYDLLVLDLAMEGISGVTVLQTLRGQIANNDVFVIVMTANPHMITQEVSQGADLVMQKPIDVNEFARFAQRLLNS